MKHNYLFIDRDGTLIVEPADQQIDSIEKLDFMPGVFTALHRLQCAGYKLVMVSNQDGLGSSSFSMDAFDHVQNLMIKVFKSQQIIFDDIRICPHLSSDGCSCRKPNVGLLHDYLIQQIINRDGSYVIGDRETDMQLAENLGIRGIKIFDEQTPSWPAISDTLLNKSRSATLKRQTNETQITIYIDLDKADTIEIKTGIGFFDHMLEQLIKHAGMSAKINVQGDLHIDDHHSIEDTALALGEVIKKALGDKRGIARYGFILPMDDAQATIALDLSGRSYFKSNVVFQRQNAGGLATEMINHFFKSLADGLQATLHINLSGENTHHMIEAMFKGVGRTLRQACKREDLSIPSTKGIL